MYGKHFESMYTGSMVGSGAMAFALMGYVIANLRPDATVGAQVELNPRLLALILGESQASVQKAIEFLCAPDPASRSKDEGGRRLVRLGEYAYRVVNGAKYHAMRTEAERRDYNRVAKQRERMKKRGTALPGEQAYVRSGDEHAQDRILDEANERATKNGERV